MYDELVGKLIEVDEAEIPGNELALIRADGKEFNNEVILP